MIDTQNCYYILERTQSSLCKYVNNATSLPMARISFMDEKLNSQNNGRNMILFYVYFGKLFNFNILIQL